MGTRGRSRSDESALEELSALPRTAERAAQIAALGKALADRHYRVIAKAAALAAERQLAELVPDLKQAYARLLQDPVKRDPNCIGKSAVARALVALDCGDTAFLLEGVRYTQMEPVWGGTADTAADVRCSCAMGLAASGYPRAVAELTGLLNDPDKRARIGAVRAVSCAHPHEAEVLLRFKIAVGDADPEVIGECFTALLAVAPDASLSFVAAFLTHENDALREYAALALGESRHPEALKHLRAAWDEVYVTPDARATLIRAAALHRTEPAFDWLLSIIERDTHAHAAIAVDALAVYERNSKLSERVQAALARRGDTH